MHWLSLISTSLMCNVTLAPCFSYDLFSSHSRITFLHLLELRSHYNASDVTHRN
uniref:Uncharacterized protein MANES_10G106200 n=1 Tax=Rhizophora mucronata TaxID=61149 RepID=A0A2P2LDA6_RHIMU